MLLSISFSFAFANKGAVIKYLSWGGGRRVFSRGMKQKYDFKEGFQTKCTKMEGV